MLTFVGNEAVRRRGFASTSRSESAFFARLGPSISKADGKSINLTVTCTDRTNLRSVRTFPWIEDRSADLDDSEINVRESLPDDDRSQQPGQRRVSGVGYAKLIERRAPRYIQTDLY